MERVKRDKVEDGRNLMNVGRLEDSFALLSYYQRNTETIKALAPRAPWMMTETRCIQPVDYQAFS
jgi:hypothetical protein